MKLLWIFARLWRRGFNALLDGFEEDSVIFGFLEERVKYLFPVISGVDDGFCQIVVSVSPFVALVAVLLLCRQKLFNVHLLALASAKQP